MVSIKRLFQTTASDYSERFANTVAAAAAVVAVAAVAAAAAVFVVGVAAAIVVPNVVCVPSVHNFAYVCPHRCIPDLAAEHACWPRRILRGRLGSWGGTLGVGFVARRIA